MRGRPIVAGIGSACEDGQPDARYEILARPVTESARHRASTLSILERRRSGMNNAGTGTNAPFAQTTDAQFDELMNVHFKGVFFLTQTLLPLIADGGRIVNLSSGLTRFSFAGYAAYASMKGAIEVLTRYLAVELGSRKIAVNTFAPARLQPISAAASCAITRTSTPTSRRSPLSDAPDSPTTSARQLQRCCATTIAGSMRSVSKRPAA